ncbi:MAG: hypothetical protein NC305_13455 [Lachnospiraceae bacterium]|nr:hypothetical protein [Butyrivibrio sp.]MCM1343995.1 hypothetical protein [Muribaculaceae bacterium]MCM1411538.1 hypothetical protein [Lachnospiraceae bacterium]
MDSGTKVMGCGNCRYLNSVLGKDGMAVCEHHSIYVPLSSDACLDHVYCGREEMRGENKVLVIHRLFQALRATRAGGDIREMVLAPDQNHVEIRWGNGCVHKVNVEADSGIAMISDVVRAIS